MEINGTVIPGFGKAKYTIFLQRGQFIERGLPFAGELKSGTLNLDMSPTLFEILQFDYLFEDTPWGEDRVETFGFIDINTIKHKGQEYERYGYIYVPYGSKHFEKKSLLEIVAKEIPDADYGDELSIDIDEGKIKIYSE